MEFLSRTICKKKKKSCDEIIILFKGRPYDNSVDNKNALIILHIII